MSTFTFGKYKTQLVQNIFQTDKSYIRWIVSNQNMKRQYPKIYQECFSLLNNEAHSRTVNPEDIIIYTDGACPNNGRSNAKAGIGVYFSPQNMEHYDNVSEPLSGKQTNQRAELSAILRAVSLTQSSPRYVHIYTDSQYSIDAITKWYPNWVKKNTLDKKNVDIISQIYDIYSIKSFSLHHVYSHTNLTDIHSEGNKQADLLARSSII